MARRPARRNQFIDQANLEAMVRFGPELSALNELRREAIGQSQTDIAAARSAGTDIVRATNAARPDIKSAYANAGKTAQQQAAIATADLSGLPANSPLRAAAALERTGLSGRLAESRAQALTDLTSRKVAAREGTRSAIQASRATLANNLVKVLDRKISLAQEQGAFTASTAMTLQEQARKDAQALAIAQGRLNQSERNSLRSAGINPDTGKPIPNGRLDPNRPGYRHGRKVPSLKSAPNSVASDIQEASRLARGMFDHGSTRQEVVQTLQSGAKPQPVYKKDKKGHVIYTVKKDKNGNVIPGSQKPIPMRNKAGDVVMTPKVPQIAQDAYLRAALDLAQYGYITRGTARHLHHRSLRADSIGTVWWQLPEATRRRRRMPPQVRAGNRGSSSTGGRPDTAGNANI